jgi:hypothetical protein
MWSCESAASSGVSTTAGATQFARMPVPARSFPIHLVIAITAALRAKLTGIDRVLAALTLVAGHPKARRSTSSPSSPSTARSSAAPNERSRRPRAVYSGQA